MPTQFLKCKREERSFNPTQIQLSFTDATGESDCVEVPASWIKGSGDFSFLAVRVVSKGRDSDELLIQLPVESLGGTWRIYVKLDQLSDRVPELVPQ